MTPGSAPKRVRQVLVAEHGDRMPPAHAIVLWSDHAPNRRPDPEHREIGARYQLAGDPIGLTAEADIERHRVPAEHAGEQRIRRWQRIVWQADAW